MEITAEVSSPPSEPGDEFMRPHLPEGPEATTSHPSNYLLIHFTFISNNNDFAPVTGGEREEAETLVGGGGVCKGGVGWGDLSLQWQSVVLLEKAASGYVAITEVTQERNNTHFHLLM